MDTGILAVQCLWNHVGSVLAVCGTKMDTMNKESNNVMFYSSFGMVSSGIYHKQQTFC